MYTIYITYRLLVIRFVVYLCIIIRDLFTFYCIILIVMKQLKIPIESI